MSLTTMMMFTSKKHRHRRHRSVVGALAMLVIVVIAACDGGGGGSFGMLAPGNVEPPPDIIDETSPDPDFGRSESPCFGVVPPTVGTDCSASWNGSGAAVPTGWTGACVYGHDVDDDCNDLYVCSTRWARKSPRPTCADRCPDSFEKIVPGATCSVVMGCSYLEGTCACVADPVGADAGSSGNDAGTQATTGRWRCVRPPGNGCPAQRPALKSDCVRSMDCDYGSCALRLDLSYHCESSTRLWRQADSPECP